MIDFERAKNWNLIYTDREFDESLISESAVTELEKIFKSYPSIYFKHITFLGNMIQGNLLYNYIVERLLLENKIKNRAIRISNYDSQMNLQYYYSVVNDILLIDNIEFNQTSSQQDVGILKTLDYFYYRTNLIFLNISLEEELKFAPRSFVNLLDISLNIKIKKVKNAITR